MHAIGYMSQQYLVLTSLLAIVMCQCSMSATWRFIVDLIVMTYSTDIHSPQRMNCTDFVIFDFNLEIDILVFK